MAPGIFQRNQSLVQRPWNIFWSRWLYIEIDLLYKKNNHEERRIQWQHEYFCWSNCQSRGHRIHHLPSQYHNSSDYVKNTVDLASFMERYLGSFHSRQWMRNLRSSCCINYGRTSIPIIVAWWCEKYFDELLYRLIACDKWLLLKWKVVVGTGDICSCVEGRGNNDRFW